MGTPTHDLTMISSQLTPWCAIYDHIPFLGGVNKSYFTIAPPARYEACVFFLKRICLGQVDSLDRVKCLHICTQNNCGPGTDATNMQPTTLKGPRRDRLVNRNGRYVLKSPEGFLPVESETSLVYPRTSTKMR